MRALKIIVISVVSLALLVGLLVVGLYCLAVWKKPEVDEQAGPEVFYTPPAQITGNEGNIIRSEPAPDWDVESAKATRILYATLDTNTNTKRVAGGTVWIPTSPSDGERRVVAWAHPTVGLGNSCAPSRNPNSLSLTSGWIQQMATEGWIVTATDYSGLGTPPPYTYLEGLQESTDVVNSV